MNLVCKVRAERAAHARTGRAPWVKAVPVVGKWLPVDMRADLSAVATLMDHSLKHLSGCTSGTTLDHEYVADQRQIRQGVTRVVNRRRTLVTIGVAIALILVAAWLAFDQPLLSARATQDEPGPGPAPDHLAGVGSSGAAHVASAPAHGNRLDRDKDAGVSSDAQSSYLSDAPTDARTQEDGTGRSSAERGTTGPGGSGPVPAASSTQSAGPGPHPDVSTSSEALPPGPAGNTRPQADAPTRPDAPAQNGAPSQSGPAASNAPANTASNTPANAGEPPVNAGRSGPPGGTTGPVVLAESAGSGSNAGPDIPDRWSSGTSGPGAAADVSPGPIPVPVPPSLLLFGASALMLWFVSRR